MQESITCISVMQLKVDVQLYVKHNHEKIAYRAEGWSAQHIMLITTYHLKVASRPG